MSPLLLRRYRAERLLRDEFESLRRRVLASVRARLRSSGVALDESDLDACYSQAWQGLYAAVLEGEEIANTAGWLVLVTFRRAIDEHRSHGPSRPGDRPALAGAEPDLADELDTRVRLRHLFEGLRGRLNQRELEAATLCYLHGLTRSEAAGRMGLSDARMRKLMEGQGPRSPGVAGKVGALVETITAGGWCEEQGSPMRALAYGLLDPDGERYRLAQIHLSECPSCRSYVLSLRGLAAVLPPVPSLLHLLLAAPAAGVGSAAGGGRSGAGSGSAHGLGGAQPAAPPPGALAGPGVAGAGGVAGGGWVLAGGSAGAKLAMGCLLALSLSAGCVALTVSPLGTHPVHQHRHAAVAHLARSVAPAAALAGQGTGESANARGDASFSAGTSLTPTVSAEREFGPEQGLAAAGQQSHVDTSARAAGASTNFEGGATTINATTRTDTRLGTGTGTREASEQRASQGSSTASEAASGAGSQAEREFGIG